MKRIRLFGLAMIALGVLGLTGCGVPQNADPGAPLATVQKTADRLETVSTNLQAVSDSLKDLKAAVVATTQAAATQPGGQAVAKVGDQVAKAVDQAAPAVDVAKTVADAVAAPLKTFVDVMAQRQADADAATARRDATIQAALQAVTTIPKVVHDVAPGSPADNYAYLGSLAGMVILNIVQQVAHRSTLKTAIVTPGTTLPPAGN